MNYLTVEELLKILENDLIEAGKTLNICRDNYMNCIEYEGRGSVIFSYGLYEKAIGDFERIRLAIDVIKERVF